MATGSTNFFDGHPVYFLETICLHISRLGLVGNIDIFVCPPGQLLCSSSPLEVADARNAFGHQPSVNNSEHFAS